MPTITLFPIEAGLPPTPKSTFGNTVIERQIDTLPPFPDDTTPLVDHHPLACPGDKALASMRNSCRNILWSRPIRNQVNRFQWAKITLNNHTTTSISITANSNKGTVRHPGSVVFSSTRRIKDPPLAVSYYEREGKATDTPIGE